MSDPSPRESAVASVQAFAARYAASLLAAVAALWLCFPGNQLLWVPWHHDDFSCLAGYTLYSQGLSAWLLRPRPVALNAYFLLGATGDTATYLVIFLAAALLPVMSVMLALRLFRIRPGPWTVIWLGAAVSFCTFLHEHATWFYRYTGALVNLMSVLLGLLAAWCYGRYFDGRRWGLAAGSAALLLAAFSKEDMLAMVPLFVLVDWWLARQQAAPGSDARPPLRQLVLAAASIAAVVALAGVWNIWIVHSPFTSGANANYQTDLTITHLVVQAWQYCTSLRVPWVAFVTLAVATVVGLVRRGRRVAALSMFPLALAMVLPYTVLPRYFDWYSLNWLPLVLAMGLACFACCGQAWLGHRAAAATVVLPAVLVAAILAGRSAATTRFQVTAWMNEQQRNARYIFDQLERHADEFAGAPVVAVRGMDEKFSPWLNSDGRYLGQRLGRPLRWLLIARPGKMVTQFMPRNPQAPGCALIFEEDLAQFPGVPVLEFDGKLNLTVKLPSRP